MPNLGDVFGETISVTRRSRKHDGYTGLRGWGARLTGFYALLLIAGFILLARLFHLTIIHGSEYRRLSEGNRVTEVTAHAPRGIIFDRNNVPLTRNIPAFRLITPCPDSDQKCVSILSQDDVLMRETTKSGEGIVEVDVEREYLYPTAFAHVLGFLSEINHDELADDYYSYQNYTLGDRIGREGIEKAWERILRGRDGKELVEIDAHGAVIRKLGTIETTAGTNIVTSLDVNLQKVAFDAMDGKTGAVIASIPKTGEILALVSSPSFDTNALQQGLSPAAFDRLLNDPDRPMFNRAIGGVYPPGSTFKLITAIAALEENAIDTDTIVEDTGVLRVGRYTYGNWYYSQYGKTEGSVDIYKALARSNDIYFYKTGEWVEIEKLAAWAKKFGIGKKSGIAIDGEAAGVMPDPDWRKENRGDEWFLGDTYHAAIGQGDIQATPLQVNLFTNVIANGGYLCKPRLEKNTEYGIQNIECKDVKISKKTLELVTEGMRRACSRGSEDTYQGTGWPLFDFAVPVACKTGTAEFNDPDDNTHAWITVFAPASAKASGGKPASEPEISVTVLLEKGGEGSTDAGPIAKKVLEEWFGR